MEKCSALVSAIATPHGLNEHKVELIGLFDNLRVVEDLEIL